MEQLGSHWTEFHKISYLRIFRKSVEQICIWQSDKKKGGGVLCMKTDIHFLSYLAHFFLEWEMFQTKAVEKIKTHFLCPKTFYPETLAVYEIMWKNMVKPDRTQMVIQCIPLATEPCISLTILNLNRSTFVVWEMKRNVSVLCVCSAPNCCDTEQRSASQPATLLLKKC